MNKKRIFIAAMALTATIGMVNLAQAWDHQMPGHKVLEHGYDQIPLQISNAAYNDHGGGHEYAQGNNAIHQQEMKDPRHKMPENVQSNIPFDQHGGGHETAPNNAAIHEKEMKDPNHKDVVK